MQAPKGVKERVKSPNSFFSLLSVKKKRQNNNRRKKTHIFFLLGWLVSFFFSLALKFSEIQPDRAALYFSVHSGLHRTFYDVCFASESCNCSIRLVTRTKEFNWSVSRSNFLCLGNAHGVAKATGETLVLFKRNLLHHRPITNICSNLGHILWKRNFFFFQGVMELLNTSVETRKMVNYARTW
jgi:hypothetical protein